MLSNCAIAHLKNLFPKSDYYIAPHVLEIDISSTQLVGWLTIDENKLGSYLSTNNGNCRHSQ